MIDDSYTIYRVFRVSRRKKILRRGVSLKVAQEHCSKPETSSSTATDRAGRARTRRYGDWFDFYTKEK